MKPTKIAKTFICSECGLDWERHPEKPSLGDCVTLLKADLAKRSKPIYEVVSKGPTTVSNWEGKWLAK